MCILWIVTASLEAQLVTLKADRSLKLSASFSIVLDLKTSAVFLSAS